MTTENLELLAIWTDGDASELEQLLAADMLAEHNMVIIEIEVTA